MVGIVFSAFKFLQARSASTQKTSTPTRTAALHIKHGPQAGKSIVINKLPFLIGRDPINDICLNDSHVISQHAKIFATDNGYYLMNLGGETFINGRAVTKSSAILKPGDVVRLGKSALFVFG